MTSLSDEAERRAFVYWLRTGWRLSRGSRVAVERKFNPWHDPRNGQFTSGDGGSARQFTGGGGSFGGGGAQSSWDGPAPRPISREKSAHKTPAQRREIVPHRVLHALPLVARDRGGGETSVLQRNGYRFAIDGQQRTVESSGAIRMGSPSPRSRLHQARAGGADRLPHDDGGHFIARRFNGPSDSFNHFAQNARFNRGQYRAIEDGWARSTRQGKAVFVRIQAQYHGVSRRPHALKVEWTIDGETWFRTFQN